MIFLFRERTGEETYRVGKLPEGPFRETTMYIEAVKTTKSETRFFAVEDDIPKGNLMTIMCVLGDKYFDFDQDYLGKLGAREVGL